ncbi:hypothetical protein V7161_30015 [Neobacillus drentensis]|uniref:hypothetical protein n=1 Tax=Neobacillus drentensis TaxID=220684 RepID=UPI0030023BDE
MGFGDFLKSTAKAAINGIQEKQERINKHKEHLQYRSDEEVIRTYKNSSGDLKFAAAMILKERGYGNQN